ncbi:MAG: DUF4130 domain-containing protein [Methanobacteriota archaeon]|nr:MAG: DUF4130 domain-containing protein [Euryarchaeota archaeon]
MLVLFTSSPRSMIRAYLAARVNNGKTIEKTRGRKFFFEDTLDADEADYDKLYEEYREKFGGLDFLENQKLYEIMEDEMFWASRFAARDRNQLIFRVLQLIEAKGTKAYLAQEAPEAKEMKDRVRRVSGEFRRARDFLSFTEDVANKVLIGRATFEHRVVDLVLRHFARRKPGYAIAILDDEHAHICLDDEILIDSRERFPSRKGRKDARRYWLLLSDIKNLSSKKDPDYDREALPDNYWKWVTEGTKTATTAGTRTLDDFP